jgi:hypothetical protein
VPVQARWRQCLHSSGNSLKSLARSAGVRPQPLRAVAMAQLGHHLALNLTNPFARESETLADLVQRVRLAVVEALAQPDDFLLALFERGQHPA